MGEYIKIEDAAKAFSCCFPYRYEDCLNGIISSIADGTIEAADVAPVGHCKDCAYFSGEHCLKLWSETNIEYSNQPKTDPEDYCSKFKKFKISKICVQNSCNIYIGLYNYNRSAYQRHKEIDGESSDLALKYKMKANYDAKIYNDFVSNLKGAFEDGSLDGLPEKLECL